MCSLLQVPLERLEGETVQWCREMMRNSPTALRILKAAMNAAEDGQAGIQVRAMPHPTPTLFFPPAQSPINDWSCVTTKTNSSTCACP